MKIIGIILLLFIIASILKIAIYILHVKLGKRSRQTGFVVIYFEDAQIKSNVAAVFLPFYDEKMFSYFGLGLGGIRAGYTPYETMLELLKKILADKYLIQICIDDLLYPSAQALQKFYRPGDIFEKMQTAFKEKNIELIDGAMLYGPDSVKNGALENGISDGNDLFYICPKELGENEKTVYRQKIQEWQNGTRLDAYFKEKEFLGAEGELFKCFEGWRLVHKDTAFLRNFINEIYRAGIRKAFTANGLSGPDGLAIPDIGDAFKDIFTFSFKPNFIKMYFDEDNFIIYREQGKKYETYVKKIAVPHVQNKRNSIWSYFLPEMVDLKAYSKRRLRMFGAQFFCLFMYLTVAMFGTFYLVDRWHMDNIILMLIICFALPIMALISLVMSLNYLSLGIFSKNEFVRAGI